MPTTTRLVGVATTAALLVMGLGSAGAAFSSAPEPLPGHFERIDNRPDSSVPASGANGPAQLSRDGRYAVYESVSSDIAAHDHNGESDVFIVDRRTGTTTLVSAATNKHPANGDSRWPSISDDGRFVTFVSFASNLPGAAQDAGAQVYRYDRRTGQSQRLTPAGVRLDDTATAQISPTGRFVAIGTTFPILPEDTHDGPDVYLWDGRTGGFTLITRSARGGAADISRTNLSVSTDGHVAFTSDAHHLVPQPRVDVGQPLVYLWSRRTGRTRLITPVVDGQGDPTFDAPQLSADARRLTFSPFNEDTQVGRLYDYDRRTGDITELGDPADRQLFHAGGDMSARGRFVLIFAYDADGPVFRERIDLYDRRTGRYRTVVDRASDDAIPLDLSADGRHVVLASYATDLTTDADDNSEPDLFVWTRS